MQTFKKLNALKKLNSLKKIHPLKRKSRKVLFMDFDETMTMSHSNGDGFVICKNNQFYELKEGKTQPIQLEGVMQASHPDGLYCVNVASDGKPWIRYKSFNAQRLPEPMEMTNPVLLNAVMTAASKKGWEPVVVSFHGENGERKTTQTIDKQKYEFTDNNNGQPLRGGSPAIELFLNHFLPSNRTYLKDKKHIVAQFGKDATARDQRKLPHMLRMAKRLGIKLNNPKNEFILADDDRRNFYPPTLLPGTSTVLFNRSEKTPFLEIAYKIGLSPHALHQAVLDSHHALYSNLSGAAVMGRTIADDIQSKYEDYLRKQANLSDQLAAPDIEVVKLMREFHNFPEYRGMMPKRTAENMLNNYSEVHGNSYLVYYDAEKQKVVLATAFNRQTQYHEINNMADYKKWMIQLKDNHPMHVVDHALFNFEHIANPNSELAKSLKFSLIYLEHQLREKPPSSSAQLEGLLVQKFSSDFVGWIQQPELQKEFLAVMRSIFPASIARSIEQESNYRLEEFKNPLKLRPKELHVHPMPPLQPIKHNANVNPLHLAKETNDDKPQPPTLKKH